MTDKRRRLIEDVAEAMVTLKASFYKGRGPVFARQGIGMPHFKLMMKMAASDHGVSVGELSEAMQVTPGAITQFIDKLVDKGLAERYQDPNDRRIARIRLTGKAKKRVEKMRVQHIERLSSMFQDLSDEELKQLAVLIRKIKVEPKMAAPHGPWHHKK